MQISSMFGVEFWGARTSGDVLYEALHDLTEHDLQRFKDVFTCLPTRYPYSLERLQKADFLGTKYVLLDAFGDEAALDVLIRIFRLIGLTKRAEDHKHEADQIAKSFKLYLSRVLVDCKEKYMDETRHSFHAIRHHDQRLGEHFNLKIRYTSIVLEKKLHKISASGQRYRRTVENGSSYEYFPTTVQDLFSFDDDREIPETVVFQGTAGMGKTMVCQRIMLDWGFGELYKDQFDFVFFISCGEIDTITSEISLSKYLLRHCCLSGPYYLLRSVFLNSERVLVILDGFDEVNLSSMTNTEVCDDPFQEVSKDILLNSLFRRTLLRDCSQIITTRPFAWMKLTDFAWCPQYVEVRGFTESQREDYVYKFFTSRDEADLVFNMIKDNDTLFDMCYLPLSAWILCTVMKQFLKHRLRLLDSMPFTSIYLWYIKSLIKYHGRKTYAQPLQICLKKLCSLAIEGVWNGRNVFEESDLAKHGVTISVFESVILKETLSQRGAGSHICYSFEPLGIQEVFAALYYVLDEKHIKHGNWKMKDLLEASEVRPHLKSTVRHLFGLSSEKQVQEAERAVGYPVAFKGEPVLEQWLRRHPSDYHNEVLDCLYEAKSKDCMPRIMSQSQNLKIEGFHGNNKDQSTITCRALAYCLEASPVRHIVFFKDYIIGPNYRNVLSKPLSRCSELHFEGCRFPKKEKAPYWEEYSLQEFFKGGQMRKLTLQRCGLTSSCCDDLRSVLVNYNLMTLDLSENNLGDSGIKLLCEGLRHRDCYLRVLRLQACGLTSAGCDDLRTVISTHRSLITLDLSRNNLRDSGVKVLCGLGCQPSTLQELMLQDCNLTASCCDDLCSVLTTKHSLMTLDLSDNWLQDSGMKLLCEGLRHLACALQELRLQMCGLTSSCCADLRSVISKNQSLTTLDLTRNNLQSSGVKLLCEGLKHPACVMQELWLWRCGLTSSCYDDLHSVLTTNRSLVILDLRGNNLQHWGVRLRQVAKAPLQLLVSTCSFRKWRLDKISEQPVRLR